MDIANNVFTSLSFPDRFVERFVWEVQEPNYVAVEVRKLSDELQDILENEKQKGSQEDPHLENKRDEPTTSSKIVFSISQGKLERKLLLSKKDWRKEDPKEQVSSRPQSSTAMDMKSSEKVDLPNDVDQVILTLFVDASKGILVHESRTDFNGKCLVGVEVPYLYVAENGAWKQKNPMLKDTKDKDITVSLIIVFQFYSISIHPAYGDIYIIQRVSMTNQLSSTLKMRIDKELIQDFDGVEEEAKVGRTALMHYVFLRLCGDIDAALKVIRTISKCVCK
jgi:hypothetical protein